MPLTKKQKEAVSVLINGGSIAHLGTDIRVRDRQTNPVTKLSGRGFYNLCHTLGILRKSKRVWVLSKAGVLSLHGNSYIKKLYKNQIKTSQT